MERSRVRFTDEEKKAIIGKAYQIWDAIAMDIIIALEGEGKNFITRAHVIELVLDADRLRHELSLDLGEKFDSVSYRRKKDLVRGAFPYSRYGR